MVCAARGTVAVLSACPGDGVVGSGVVLATPTLKTPRARCKRAKKANGFLTKRGKKFNECDSFHDACWQRVAFVAAGAAVAVAATVGLEVVAAAVEVAATVGLEMVAAAVERGAAASMAGVWAATPSDTAERARAEMGAMAAAIAPSIPRYWLCDCSSARRRRSRMSSWALSVLASRVPWRPAWPPETTGAHRVQEESARRRPFHLVSEAIHKKRDRSDDIRYWEAPHHRRRRLRRHSCHWP
jgi:hypothetical protein